jgi:hypothetical protein
MISPEHFNTFSTGHVKSEMLVTIIGIRGAVKERAFAYSND